MNINFTSVIESNNKYNIQIFQYVKAEQWDLLLEFILKNNIDYSIRDNSNIYLLEYAINFNKIEIVEAGQFNNVNGRDAELAPALNPNSGITLGDKYGDNLKNKAFYIRPKLFINIPPGPAVEDDTIPMAPRS